MKGPLGRDEAAIGGKAIVIILALLLISVFVLSSVAQPYAARQTVYPGDTLTYQYTLSGPPKETKQMQYRVVQVNLTHVQMELREDWDPPTTAWYPVTHDGRALVITNELVVNDPFWNLQLLIHDVFDFQKSTSIGLFGGNLMLLDVYTSTDPSFNLTFTMKMGTMIPLKMVFENSGVSMVFELKETNIEWLFRPSLLS